MADCSLRACNPAIICEYRDYLRDSSRNENESENNVLTSRLARSRGEPPIRLAQRRS